MGLTVLPDHILKRMSAEDRKSLGKAGVTASEADAKQCAELERELQKQMANLLRQRDLFFVQSRMDKRTTTRKGMPDFIIVLPGGRALAVEVKVQGRGLRDEQEQVHADYFRQVGEMVYTLRTLDEFRELLEAVAVTAMETKEPTKI